MVTKAEPIACLESKVKTLFVKYGDDSNGGLNSEDLVAVLRSLDENMPTDKVKSMFDNFEKKAGGVFTLDELYENLFADSDLEQQPLPPQDAQILEVQAGELAEEAANEFRRAEQELQSLITYLTTESKDGQRKGPTSSRENQQAIDGKSNEFLPQAEEPLPPEPLPLHPPLPPPSPHNAPTSNPPLPPPVNELVPSHTSSKLCQVPSLHGIAKDMKRSSFTKKTKEVQDRLAQDLAAFLQTQIEEAQRNEEAAKRVEEDASRIDKVIAEEVLLREENAEIMEEHTTRSEEVITEEAPKPPEHIEVPKPPKMEELKVLEVEELAKAPKPPETKELEVMEAEELAQAEEEAKTEKTRPKAEAEAKQKAEEEARLRQNTQEWAKKKAEENAERTIEEEAKKKEEEDARLKAEVEAKQKAEEEAMQWQSAQEWARKKAEEDSEKKVEDEAKEKEEEDARLKAEMEAKQKAEEEMRKKADEDVKKKDEEEAKKKEEEESKPPPLPEIDEKELYETQETQKKASAPDEPEAKLETVEEAEKKADEESKPQLLPQIDEKQLYETQETQKKASAPDEPEAKQETMDEAQKKAEDKAEKEEEEQDARLKANQKADEEARQRQNAQEWAQKKAEEDSKKTTEEEAKKKEEEQTPLKAEVPNESTEIMAAHQHDAEFQKHSEHMELGEDTLSIFRMQAQQALLAAMEAGTLGKALAKWSEQSACSFAEGTPRDKDVDGHICNAELRHRAWRVLRTATETGTLNSTLADLSDIEKLEDSMVVEETMDAELGGDTQDTVMERMLRTRQIHKQKQNEKKFLEEPRDEVPSEGDQHSDAQVGYADAIVLTGTSKYPRCLGAYVRSRIPPGPRNAGRAIYKGPGKKHLYYWSEISKWLIGDDYTTCRAWLCSANDENFCASQASAWREWDDSSRAFHPVDTIKVQKVHCADAVLVSGTSTYPRCQGIYVGTSIIPCTENGRRVIFKGPGSQYLFYWSGISKWMIGADYANCRAWICSATTESWCPSNVGEWREWGASCQKYEAVATIKVCQARRDAEEIEYEERVLKEHNLERPQSAQRAVLERPRSAQRVVLEATENDVLGTQAELAPRQKSEQESVDKVFAKSKSKEDNRLKVVYEPGLTGVLYDSSSGEILGVDEGGRAQHGGVRVGMHMLTIDGSQYSDQLFQAAKNGTKTYEVAYSTSCKVDVADAVVVTGATQFPSCNGTYLRSSMPSSTCNASRAIFKGPGGKYLYYWRDIQKWVIGDDYKVLRAWLCSVHDENWCPTRAVGWKEWDTSSKKFEPRAAIQVQKVSTSRQFKANISDEKAANLRHNAAACLAESALSGKMLGSAPEQPEKVGLLR